MFKSYSPAIFYKANVQKIQKFKVNEVTELEFLGVQHTRIMLAEQNQGYIPPILYRYILLDVC